MKGFIYLSGNEIRGDAIYGAYVQTSNIVCVQKESEFVRIVLPGYDLCVTLSTAEVLERIKQANE